MEEEWKFWKETNSSRWGKRIYEVSNKGNIKINGQITEPHDKQGYFFIGGYPVHRMVAELFIPNPEVLKKMSDASKDRTWINKNNVRKKVKNYQLDSYLNDGWVLGRGKIKNK